MGVPQPGHEERPDASPRSGTVLVVADFAARYPGNFLATELLVGAAVRERLGLDCAFVLPERAGKRDWLSQITESDFRYELLPAAKRERVTKLLHYGQETAARVMHSHFVWFDIDCLIVAARLGARSIWHLHNGLSGYPIRQRASDLVKARLLARAVDAVVACSASVGVDAARRGFPTDRIEVLANGIVLDRLRRPPETRREVRQSLGVGEQTFLVLALGWPPGRKGVDVFVRGLEMVASMGTVPVMAVVVGEPALREFVESVLGTVPPWLKIVPAVDDFASLLTAADVFVSSSREEGFSYAIGEAMACSRPVVASDIAGTAHYWDASGLLRYPAADPTALADRLVAVMSPPQPEDLGEANRAWAWSHLDVTAHIDARIDLYARVMASHAGDGRARRVPTWRI